MTGPFLWTGQSRLDGGGILAGAGDRRIIGDGTVSLGNGPLENSLGRFDSMNLSGGRLVASNVTVTVQSPAQVSAGAAVRRSRTRRETPCFIEEPGVDDAPRVT